MLFQLENEFQGINSSWFDKSEMTIRAEKMNFEFTGKNGIVKNIDVKLRHVMLGHPVHNPAGARQEG